MLMISRIIRGCGHLPGYGSHPGTGYIAAFLVAISAAGALDEGKSWLVGVLIGLAFGSPLFAIYLYGAHSRAASFDRSQKKGDE